MKFFNHPEGYVDASGSGYEYVYQYKDHLGNIRLSYKDNNGTLEIQEENNYYPFGLKHKGYNSNIVSEHPYKFNGKELNEELGLDWYDYGARNYDAALGRWMNLDPLAENYYSDSPYVYTANNPILYLDVDGRYWIDNKDGTWTAEAGDSASTLAEDANISFEKAKEIMANTKKDNSLGNMGTYIDPEDGVEKSAVDEGDVVAVGEIMSSDTGDIRVVSDDADVAETDTSNKNFGESEKVTTNADKLELILEVSRLIVPRPEEIIFGRSNELTGPKSRTRTTSPAPSNTAPKNATREVNVKGHWRTLKDGKKVWVKPHTRTIKNKN